MGSEREISFEPWDVGLVSMAVASGRPMPPMRYSAHERRAQLASQRTPRSSSIFQHAHPAICGSLRSRKQAPFKLTSI
jgi:hypothetical protein